MTTFSLEGLNPSELIATQNKGSTRRAVRILALDDDPMFCRMLEETAKRHQIFLVPCTTVAEFHALIATGIFDGVLIDYALGDKIGPEVAMTTGRLPVVLMSASDNWIPMEPDWPKTIVRFLYKQSGVEDLLEEAAATISIAVSESLLEEPLADEDGLKELEAALFRVVIAAAVLATLLFSLRFTMERQAPSPTDSTFPLKWDAAPTFSTHRIAER